MCWFYYCYGQIVQKPKTLIQLPAIFFFLGFALEWIVREFIEWMAEAFCTPFKWQNIWMRLYVSMHVTVVHTITFTSQFHLIACKMCSYLKFSFDWFAIGTFVKWYTFTEIVLDILNMPTENGSESAMIKCEHDCYIYELTMRKWRQNGKKNKQINIQAASSTKFSFHCSWCACRLAAMQMCLRLALLSLPINWFSCFCSFFIYFLVLLHRSMQIQNVIQKFNTIRVNRLANIHLLWMKDTIPNEEGRGK